MTHILGVGYCTMDFLGVVERFAQPEHKLEYELFSQQGGGPAATALVALARWGMSTSFLGKVGDDARGDHIVATLAEEGVDTHHIVRQKGGISQCSFVVVESATMTKQTYFTRGTITPLEADEIGMSVLDGVDILHVDGYAPQAQLALMREASERDIMVLLDAEDILHEHTTELVEHCDVLLGSERFASQLTGEGSLDRMSRALIDFGPDLAILTLGQEGSVAYRRGDDDLVRAPAYPVEVFDRTGAGDVFHGAIIYALAHDWKLERACAFANAAAGVSCTGLGGRSKILGLDELLERIEEGG